MAKKSNTRKPRSTAARQIGTPASMEQIAMAHRSKTDLISEYSYVITDLRRIGLLAALLVAGLVIASFFMP